MEQEIDGRFGAAPVVMWALHWAAVGKKEMSSEPTLWIYPSVRVPTLSCGHELTDKDVDPNG